MATREIKTSLMLDGEAKFKEALRGAYSEMKVLGSELKLGIASFKNTGDAQEYMRSRSETLRKEIDQQKQIITALQKAVVDATAKYGEGSPKVDEYRAKLNNAQAALQNMEKQLSNTEQGLDDSGRALVETGEKTEDLDKKSDTLANTLSKKVVADGLKGFISGLMNVISKIKDTALAIWDLAKSAGQFADTLITTSIQTGISTQSLQEWSYAARFVDTEVETVTSSMVKLIRSMTSTSKETKAAFTELGVSVTDASGNLRDSETVFWECIAALGEIDNATQRDALALQIFGKSAQDLNPLIVAGADTWRAYCEEAQAAGLVLSEDAVGSLGEFDDTMQRVDATVEALKNNFVVAFLPVFQAVGDTFTEIATKINEWLQTEEAQAFVAKITENIGELTANLGDKLKPIIDTIIDVITAAMSVVSWLIENGSVLIKVIETAAVVIGVLTIAQIALNVAMMANPIGLIIAGVAAAITAVAGLIIWFGDATTAIDHWADSIIPFSKTLDSAKASIVDMNSVLSAHGRTLSEIDGLIKETEGNITDILRTAIAEQRQLRDDELIAIQEYNDKLLALQREKLMIYEEQMSAEITKLNLGLDKLTQEQAAMRIKNMEAYAAEAYALADKSYTEQLTLIDNKHRAEGTIGSEAHAAELAAAAEYYEASVADIDNYIAEFMGIVIDGAEQWVDTDAERWAKLNDGTSRSKKEYAAALAELDADNAEAFLNMYWITMKYGGEISEEQRQLAANIVGSFDDVPRKLRSQAKDAMLGLVGGFMDEIPGLEDTSEMTAMTISQTVANALGCNSPSTVMYAIGEDTIGGLDGGIISQRETLKYTLSSLAEDMKTILSNGLSGTDIYGQGVVSGLWQGISDSSGWLKTKISSWTTSVVNSFKSDLGIRSPSALFRHAVGFEIGAGTALGVIDSIDTVRTAMAKMQAAIDPTRAGSVTVGMAVEMSAPSYKRIQMAIADGMSSVQRGDIILQINDRELGRVVRGYA